MGGGTWVVNPSLEQQKGAALSLLYAGTHNACTLLEVQVRRAAHAIFICTTEIAFARAWSAVAVHS